MKFDELCFRSFRKIESRPETDCYVIAVVKKSTTETSETGSMRFETEYIGATGYYEKKTDTFYLGVDSDDADYVEALPGGVSGEEAEDYELGVHWITHWRDQVISWIPVDKLNATGILPAGFDEEIE